MKKCSLASLLKFFFTTIISLIFLQLPSFGQTAKKTGSANDWITFNRTYNGDRYSPLKQVTPANVGKLHLLHTFDMGSDASSNQSGPVVIDGIMYFATDTVTYAIDAATGVLKWKRKRDVAHPKGLGVNRGVAYYDGKLFRGASDTHVFALNASDGKIIWDVPLDEADLPGASIPMAPIAWNGMVFIGHAGGDNVGVTGHVYALDVNDGHKVWKFNVVPDDANNAKNWPSAAKGIPLSGGCFWTSFSLDPENGILFVPAGNPAPDFDVEVRGGDNLYTNCLIALDTKTGKMLGYKQLVKKDLHDWDVSTAPVLITTKAGLPIVASANKDGLLTVVDRSSLKMRGGALNPSEAFRLIYSVPTTVRENVELPMSRDQFTYFKPGILGGSEWNGAAYHPGLDLIYTGAVDWGVAVKLPPLDSARVAPEPGAEWLGGKIKFDPAPQARGWITAFNAKDGSVRWKFQAPAPVLAGVTPTAGGVVFSAAQNGDVYGFDAQTGKILWKTSTSLPNGGGVVSYAVNGKQYIAVAAGLNSGLWPNRSKVSRMLIYGL